MGKKGNYKPQKWEHRDGYRSNHFTRMYDSMLHSPAWLALSDSAKWQYTVIKSQYKGGYQQTDGSGNAMVKCPYNDIQKAGIKSNETVSNNFKQLEAFGFITASHNGFKVANQYKFSDKWKEISDEEASKIKAELKAERRKAKKSPPPTLT